MLCTCLTLFFIQTQFISFAQSPPCSNEKVEVLDTEQGWLDLKDAFERRCDLQALSIAQNLKELEKEAPRVETYTYLLLINFRLGRRAEIDRLKSEADEIWGPPVRDFYSCFGHPDYGYEYPNRIKKDVSERQFEVQEPEYPPLAQELGLEGICHVRFTADKSGHVRDAAASCTDPIFESAAMKLIAGTTFPPKTSRGEPVERVNVVYPVVFRLHESNVKGD